MFPAPTAADVAPDSWYLTHLAMNLLDYTHTSTGMAWWETIVAVTIGFRVVTLPLTLMSMRNAAAMMRIKPKSEALVRDMQLCSTSSADGKRRYVALNKALQKLYADNNCHPLKSLVPVFGQMPIWVFMFSGLQAMSSDKAAGPWPGFETGGILWFANIAVPDQYYLVPVAGSMSMMAIAMLQDPAMAPSKSQARMMQGVTVALSLFFLPIMSRCSMATNLYIVSTNAFAVLQQALLRHPGVRQALGLARPPAPDAVPAAAAVPLKVKREKYQPRPRSRSRRSAS